MSKCYSLGQCRACVGECELRPDYPIYTHAFYHAAPFVPRLIVIAVPIADYRNPKRFYAPIIRLVIWTWSEEELAESMERVRSYYHFEGIQIAFRYWR